MQKAKTWPTDITSVGGLGCTALFKEKIAIGRAFPKTMTDFLQRWSTQPEPLTAEDAPARPDQWGEYYEAVAGHPPRDTLLAALAYIERESTEPAAAMSRLAVDLGCGDGRDTAELLRRRWRVIAVDGEPEAITRLRQRHDIDRTYLETRVQRFEELTLPPDIDLINASFSLPFCPPFHFAELWEELETALKPGGWFCGQLFGDKDDWATQGDMSCHSRKRVEELFEAFEIKLLDEHERNGKTALGHKKHWHIFNVVAQKRP